MEIVRCSKCDTRFPLSGQKRRYIVMPATPAGAPDPLLAAGIAEAETRVDRQAEGAAPPGPAESMQVEMAPLPDAIPPESADAADDGFFGMAMEDDEALFGIDETSPDPSTAADPGPDTVLAEQVERRPTHPIREALGVFLLAGLGGAAGFHGSLQFGFEPLRAVAVGLAVGLTLGWAWIRWAERKR